jgi:hypothetical protein
MRVLSIFGARPEAIKMAPVVMELAKYPGELKSIMCVTGQHREILDQVLDLFAIKPDLDLGLMEENQSLASLSARPWSPHWTRCWTASVQTSSSCRGIRQQPWWLAWLRFTAGPRWGTWRRDFGRCRDTAHSRKR